jgi:hypothetical protein
LGETCVNDVDALLSRPIDPPGEARGVLEDLSGALFEGDEDPRLSKVARTQNQRLDPEDRLSATRSSKDHRDPPRWQAPASDLVEARNAGGDVPNTSHYLTYRLRVDACMSTAF